MSNRLRSAGDMEATEATAHKVVEIVRAPPATFHPDATFTMIACGVAASLGAVRGQIVFTAEEAVELAADAPR